MGRRRDDSVRIIRRAGLWSDAGLGSGRPAGAVTPDAGQNATHRWPQVLPGNRGVLFTASSNSGDYTDADIVVQDASGDRRKTVWRRGYHGRYLSSGHLVYVSDGTLFVVTFDLDRLEVSGQPIPFIEGIASNSTTGAAQFAASNNGTMAYVRADPASFGLPIVWMNREGQQTPAGSPTLNWFGIRISPDGSRFAIESNNDISIYEWARDRLTQVTFGGLGALSPAWTPDGRHLAFGSRTATTNVSNLYWQNVDRAGTATRLTDSPNPQTPGSWYPSGRFLAFTERVTPSNYDLMILPMESDGASGLKVGVPKPFTITPFAESEPAFSPDGRWIAYVSNESGRSEIFVQAFPGGGQRAKVSSTGGRFPTWSRVDHELFFSADARIMVATYAITGDTFVPDKAEVWANIRFGERLSRMFDLHPDGTRFALAPARNTQVDHVTFVFNSFDELRRLAPLHR